MQALVATHNDALVEVREVPEPTAAPNEAIIEVHAFSLNRGELSLLASRPEGWRPGQDISGVVVQQAADGSGPKSGTRVVGLVDGAGWSQRVAAPTTRLTALPDEVSFAAAATLPVAGITALRTLRFGGSLLGRRVLITGASGGVGRFAVQLGARGGARITAIAGSSERGQGLRELGATEIVTKIEDAQGLFELILESVGGSSLETAIRLIAPEGTVVVYGNSSGQDAKVNLYSFFGHEGSRLQSFFSFSSGTPESFGQDLGLLASLVSTKELTPKIGAQESWKNLKQVATALRDRRVTGKAIFLVDE